MASGDHWLHAVLDRCQIGRRVEERAVLLLHDKRCVVPGEKHTLRAVALGNHALVG